MPIYEYRCEDCGRRTTVLHRSVSNIKQPTCPRCEGTNLKRLISNVSYVRSEEARLESLADPSTWGDLDEDDPKSLARFMKKMSNEMGEDLGPEFEEVVDRLEAGQSPEEIEEEMPDLDDDMGMGGGYGGGGGIDQVL